MDLVWLVVGALAVGVAKTSIGGLAVLAVMAFALAMPTKESTGAVLLVYLAGDVVATLRYRRTVEWRLLLNLVPWVVPGLALGAWFLAAVDAITLKRWIGVLLAVSVVLQVVMSWREGRRASALPPPRRFSSVVGTGAAGLAAGFTTMAANTGGPVMTLYLLAKRIDKVAFVGTAAWFFFAVNLAKLPFSIGVGAITPEVALRTLPLVPVVWVGCAIGIWVLAVIPQRLFNSLALLSAAVAAVTLLLS